MKLLEFFDRAAREKKKVVGYGASTKGNVLLQFCNITPQMLPCIAEVNEDKFGCFTPGTWIPIVVESEARALNPDYFMVLPWHFRDGIVKREAAFRERGGKLLFPLPESRDRFLKETRWLQFAAPVRRFFTMVEGFLAGGTSIPSAELKSISCSCSCTMMARRVSLRANSPIASAC